MEGRRGKKKERQRWRGGSRGMGRETTGWRGGGDWEWSELIS